jgi:hypothetical protein
MFHKYYLGLWDINVDKFKLIFLNSTAWRFRLCGAWNSKGLHAEFCLIYPCRRHCPIWFSSPFTKVRCQPGSQSVSLESSWNLIFNADHIFSSLYISLVRLLRERVSDVTGREILRHVTNFSLSPSFCLSFLFILFSRYILKNITNLLTPYSEIVTRSGS